MGLSDDQKAILRLLTQRGEQGYEDLSALMGIDATEVHARARAAAAELEAEGIPAPSIPSPPAAGEAPAPAQAAPAQEAVKTADTPPEAAKPVDKVVEAKAAEPAPESPKPGPNPAPVAPPPPVRPAPAPGAGGLTLPEGKGARAAIFAGIAIAVVVVVGLFVLLLVNSGGSDDKTSGSTDTAAGETVDTSGNPKLTQAVLSPVDGGDAKGVATFGRIKNSLALQVEAEGLEPTGKGESYTIWLYASPQKMLPLASTAVPASGKIAAQVQVPTEVLVYLANETFDQLDISSTTDATLKASLAKATKEKKAPIYTGTDVLRGTIEGPIVGAADKGGK